jgi:predicted nucleotidyltransferase
MVGDSNLYILTQITGALGDLRNSVVFIGGCATELLVTITRAETIRVTDDIDAVAEVTCLREYHELERALRHRGFQPDQTENAPVCRWLYKGTKLDLMPSQPGVLPFHNRWYPLAIETAQEMVLAPGLTIRLIAAPAFLATKLEAFKGRGNGDYLASRDLEDIVTVVDGRPELLNEVQAAPKEINQFLAAEINALLTSAGFVDSLPAHLPGDSASQARLPIILQRLRSLANP